MKKVLGILTFGLMLCLTGCGVKSSQAYYDYDPKVISTELDGTYNIRVFGRARNAMDAYNEAKKQAVYDVIFRGVKSASSRIPDLKPLTYEVNAREKHEDYFNVFFADKGAWNDFVTMRDNRTLSEDYQRNKQQVMVQVSATVDRPALKKKLQEDGIIK